MKRIHTVTTVSFVALAALLAACGSGDQGPAGPAGPPGGATGDGSVSLVTPTKGLLDREMEVEIGGNGTKFDSGAMPDFGPGVTVESVDAASTSLLVATIKIAKDAPLGKRDVKIGNVTATAAFTILPAIDVKATTVEQGGLVQFDITNNDTAAFDTNTFGITMAGVLDVGSSASTAMNATGFVLAAPLAATAKQQVTAQNLGADGKPRLTFLSDPTAFEITPRAPGSLTLGTAAPQTFTDALSTKLFKVTTPANTTVIVDYGIVTTADDQTLPYTFVFGGGGTEADQLAFTGPPSSLFGPEPGPYDLHTVMPILGGTAATDHYVVVADLSGTPGSKATLTATATTATKIAESATAHAQDAPQAIAALPATDGQIVDASLGAGTEIDAYQLTGVVGDKVEIGGASFGPDVEIIVTKDPTVLEDPFDATPDTANVVGDFFAGAKASGNAVVTLAAANVYVVVRRDTQGKVATGKYAISARKLP